jgi:ApaG protein
MEVLTTKGITVKVEAFYQPEHSQPAINRYVHAYRVTIENHSKHVVQLLRRHWYIVDAFGNRQEVEGEGVVGKQPVLHPSDSHTYTSWCPLPTEMGKMYGTYLMERKENNEQFQARIPEFKLIAPGVRN